MCGRTGTSENRNEIVRGQNLEVSPSATFFNAEIMRAEWIHPIEASMFVRDLVNIKNPPDSGSGGYVYFGLDKENCICYNKSAESRTAHQNVLIKK